MTTNIERKRTVDFQGALDVISIDNVFQLLHYTNLSGKLVLLNPPAKATFYFSRGMLNWGTLHTQQKQLGQRLIDLAAITHEQLSECLTIRMSGKEKCRLGEILMQRGFLQSDILNQSLKDQVRDAFFHVLSWNKGTFAFCSDIPANESVTFDERIDHLLLEAVVSFDRKNAEAEQPFEQPV